LRVIFSNALELLQNIGLAGYRAGWRASGSARIGAFGAIEIGSRSARCVTIFEAAIRRRRGASNTPGRSACGQHRGQPAASIEASMEGEPRDRPEVSLEVSIEVGAIQPEASHSRCAVHTAAIGLSGCHHSLQPLAPLQRLVRFSGATIACSP